MIRTIKSLMHYSNTFRNLIFNIICNMSNPGKFMINYNTRLFNLICSVE